MTTSFSAEMRDLIDEAFLGQYGGRASTAEVLRSVASTVPPELRDELIARGIRSQISDYFGRRAKNGMRQAPAVNDDDQHVLHTQLTFPEFEYVFTRLLGQGDAAYAQAQLVADECEAQHGRRPARPEAGAA